jgi:hypothetical protein
MDNTRVFKIFILLTVLIGCRRSDVRGPEAWQTLVNEEMTKRLQTRYDTVFEDVGLIKAVVGDRMYVYEELNGKVGRSFSYEHGVAQGYSFEWYPDGALWFVSRQVEGLEHGTSVEFDHANGWQYLREYDQGKLVTTDSVPLTVRPRMELFTLPQRSAPDR